MNFLHVYLFISRPALQQSQLLSEGQEKYPTDLFSQVGQYSFCYTGLLDCHILFDLYYNYLFIYFYFELLQSECTGRGDRKEEE